MINKKTTNKYQDDIKTNDYLNFIRRNQQIVRQFKNLDSKPSQFDQHQSPISETHQSITFKPHPSPIVSSHEFNHPPISQNKNDMRISLKYMQEGITYNDIETPVARRKNQQSDLLMKIVENEANIEIKTRNLSIPSQFGCLKNQNQFDHPNKSKVTFPKLSKTHSKVQDNIQSDSSKSLEKEMISPPKKRASHTNASEEIRKSSKGRYVPIELINVKQSDKQQPEKPKNKQYKFTDISKSKLNGKLIRTYYDFENMMEFKDRVAELVPTFKPLQPRKREKVHFIKTEKYQGELEKYLETNKFEKPIRQMKQSQSVVRSKRKIEGPSKKHKDIIKQESTESLSQKKSKTCNSPVKNAKSPKQLIFPSKNQEQSVYQNKIQSYREFLFLVNFVHRIFDPILLKDDPDSIKPDKKYKYFLGKGNNSLLVKSLMKRRFWWVQTDEIKEANFVWTQLKNNIYYQYQRTNMFVDAETKFDKLDEDHPYSPQKPQKQKISDNKKQEQKIQSGILRGQLPEKESKIFTNADRLSYDEMLEKPEKFEVLKKFENRLKYLPDNFLKAREYEHDEQMQIKIPHILERVHNHFVNNFEIGNKKAMFYHLRHYYQLIDRNPYDVIPLTFHIKKGTSDPQYIKFLKEFKKLKSELDRAEKSNQSTKKLSKNVWIVKPGEISNRGNGITVIDEIYELNSILKQKNNKHSNGQQKTYIVQKYIQKPLLYKNRKFDIRHYMMISRLHGRKRAYWFSEGYIRTSSYQYDLEDVGDVMIHLTNDAIQKNCGHYGKYEEGNKISYAEFQRYLDNTYPDKKYSFVDLIYPKMREIALDAIKATYLWMDPQRLEHNFEIFGLDFMIDSKMNVWLIQINTNPCLELSSGLLTRIIPTMLEHSFRLALDPIFPPTAHYPNMIKYMAPDNPMERLQYQLIFDEGRDGKVVQEVLLKAGKADCGEVDEQDEVYENDGKQIDIGGDID